MPPYPPSSPFNSILDERSHSIAIFAFFFRYFLRLDQTNFSRFRRTLSTGFDCWLCYFRYSRAARRDEWTPERFHRWARTIGPSTEALVAAILTHRPHPEQGFRSCLGILRLYRGIEPARAEAVSARALEIGALNYRSVASILANNLDHAAARQSRKRFRCSIIPMFAGLAPIQLTENNEC